MNETKPINYTKGPMEVSYDGPSRPIICTSNHEMLSISKFSNGRWGSYEQEEADCILFSAAEDLLEALQDCFAFLKGYDMQGKTEGEIISAARKALRKVST